MRKFMFFHPNDGTVPYPHTENEQIFHNIIDGLEREIERLQSRNRELNNDIQQYQGRFNPDVIPVRDEQRIDRDMALRYTDSDNFFMNLRRQQATRIVQRLLENNLVDHTFRPDEPNGDYYSRMDLRVVRNNSE